MRKKESITCSSDDHGKNGLTFDMPKEIVLAWKAADKSFKCPEGHGRVWNDDVVDRAREKIRRLLENDDSEEVKQLKKELREEKKKIKDMEEVFSKAIAKPGVVSFGSRRHVWKCSCGSVGRSPQTTENQAQKLLEQHIENVHDGERPSEEERFECSCGDKFNSEHALNGHKATCDI